MVHLYDFAWQAMKAVTLVRILDQSGFENIIALADLERETTVAPFSPWHSGCIICWTREYWVGKIRKNWHTANQISDMLAL